MISFLIIIPEAENKFITAIIAPIKNT